MKKQFLKGLTDVELSNVHQYFQHPQVHKYDVWTKPLGKGLFISGDEQQVSRWQTLPEGPVYDNNGELLFMVIDGIPGDIIHKNDIIENILLHEDITVEQYELMKESKLDKFF